MDQNYYNEIINYLMNGTIGPGCSDQEKAAIVKRSSKYKVIGGVLYHKGKGRGIDDLRLVLTDPADQENAIRACHFSESTGRHFGRNKTASLLASKYYWRMMYTDVMHHVADCSSCCLNRELLERKSVQDRTKVWKLVEVEFLENFHTTRHYTFHLLKMVDVFSKWTRCVAVHSNSERNIVGTLLEQFGSFGFPVAVRFVNCKTISGTLAALQKELELFVKRAGDTLPILGQAGVDVEGIGTCFRDMTVHVAVEEGENVLCDFDSFEDYLRAFQFSRGQEEASSPVFHVLFGEQSVVETPIRNWLMEKITHLKKQNAYNWASHLPFYIFCLQNCVPPTMTQSPFSIMFNRSPREEPLWCWYDKTQYIQVHDDTPLDGKEKIADKLKEVPQKNKMQSVVKKKEPQKRPQFEETDCKPAAKKVRLGLERKSYGGSTLLHGSAVKDGLQKPSKDVSPQHKTIKDSPLFSEKLNQGDLYSRVMPGQLRKKSYLYKNKDGSFLQMPIEEALPLYQPTKNSSILNRPQRNSPSTYKTIKDSSALNKSNKEVFRLNKSTVDITPLQKSTANKSSKESSTLNKSTKENLATNKLNKDSWHLSNLAKDRSPTSKSSKDKKSSSKFTKDDSSPKKSKNQHSTKESSSKKNLEVTVPVLKLSLSNKDISPLAKELKKAGQENLQPKAAPVEEGQILRALCMEQAPSTLKKRFPGRPYKKRTRKYVDMATEVPVLNRPHELPPISVAPASRVSTKNAPAGELPLPATPKSPSKPRVNGEETPSNPSRYSFRQNLKPRGPSSYVQRFIAISSSKRTTANESDIEVTSPKSSVDNGSLVSEVVPTSMPVKSDSIDSDFVDDLKFPHVVEQVELVGCDLIQGILDSPSETVVPPLTNGECEEDDTVPYESELYIDDSSVVSSELDREVSKEDDGISVSKSAPSADKSVSNVASISKADSSVSKETNILNGESVTTSEEIEIRTRTVETIACDTNLSDATRENEEAPKAEDVPKLPSEAGEMTSGSSVCENNLDLSQSEENSCNVDKPDLKPVKVTLSRLSGFVTQRALEGTIQLRRVTQNNRCSLFMGDLKISDYSPEVQKKVVLSSMMCKRVIRRRRYAEKRPFKCLLCPRTYLDSEEEQTLHMRFHDDGVEGLFCPICKRSGQSWRLIFRHFFTHKEAMGDANVTCVKYRKVCTACQKVFATEERLQKHIRFNHPTEGDQSFLEPKTLGRHQQIRNDTTYQCEECGYSTKTHYNYILHTKTFHESQRLDSAAKEGNSANAMDVALDDTGLFTCQTCNYKTMTEQDLTSHIHLRHGINRSAYIYSCDQCGKKFRSQVQLCNHVLSHQPSDFFFICKLCPYKAKYKSVIHKHAKKFHPNFALKDVVQRPKTVRKVGRPTKVVAEQLPKQEELVHNPEDDIPTATVVVSTDENGELTVCEEDEDAMEAPQIICVDSEGNFVLEEGGQTLQLVGGSGEDQQLLLVSMEPENS